MNAAFTDRPFTADEFERHITHVVPAVELRGSRDEKLRRLDRLMGYLEELRCGIAGAGPLEQRGIEGPSPHANSPAWPWFGAGVVLAVLFVLFAVTRWM